MNKNQVKEFTIVLCVKYILRWIFWLNSVSGNKTNIYDHNRAVRDVEVGLCLEGLTLTDESRWLVARWVKGS